MKLRKTIGSNEALNSIICWLDEEAAVDRTDPLSSDKIDWLRVLPFLLLHLACFGVIWTGWSPVAVWTAFGVYLIGMKDGTTTTIRLQQETASSGGNLI